MTINQGNQGNPASGQRQGEDRSGQNHQGGKPARPPGTAHEYTTEEKRKADRESEKDKNPQGGKGRSSQQYGDDADNGRKDQSGNRSGSGSF